MREIPVDVLYDKRLVERHVAQGLISREDVDKRLAAMEDVAELGNVIDLDELTAGKAPVTEAQPNADAPPQRTQS